MDTERIKTEIKNAINSGLGLEQMDDICDKVSKVIPDLDIEDFYAIYGDVLKEFQEQAKQQAQAEPEEKKDQVLAEVQMEEVSGNSEEKRPTTVVVNNKQKQQIMSDKKEQELGKTIDFSVERKVQSENEQKLANIDTLGMSPQEYAEGRFKELMNVLTALVTPEHYADIKTKQGMKKFPTSHVAIDLLSMMNDVELDVQTKEVLSFTGDVKVVATCNIHDKRRNVTIKGIAVEEFVKKVRYDSITKQDRVEYFEASLETAITRCIRNAIFKLIPKKVLDMIEAEAKRQLIELNKIAKKTTAKPK